MVIDPVSIRVACGGSSWQGADVLIELLQRVFMQINMSSEEQYWVFLVFLIVPVI